MERSGWRTAIAGSSDLRVVDVVGGTGAGKSAIGNIVTNNQPPPEGAGFKEGTTAASETTEVQTLEATVTLPHTTLMGLTRYLLSWSDTQGICDTGGRTVAFLDHIVEHMRTNPPNGIVLVYNSAEKDTAQAKLGYKAMKLCFNESLPDGRTILVMNKMPPLALLRRSYGRSAPEEYAKIYSDNLSRVCTALGMGQGGLSNVVPVEMNALDNPDDDWVNAIRTRIANFPPHPMDCSRFKTFTEVLLMARRFERDALDAVTVADNTIADIRSRNNNIKNDIQWHETRIASMKAAIPIAAAGGLTSSVVLGLMSFGIGAAVAGAGTAAAVAALTAALVESQNKAPALKKQLQKNEAEIVSIHEDKEWNLLKEKAKYIAFLREVEEVESVMSMTVQP